APLCNDCSLDIFPSLALGVTGQRNSNNESRCPVAMKEGKRAAGLATRPANAACGNQNLSLSSPRKAATYDHRSCGIAKTVFRGPVRGSPDQVRDRLAGTLDSLNAAWGRSRRPVALWLDTLWGALAQSRIRTAKPCFSKMARAEGPCRNSR